ncbi:hypothetical protein B6V74_04270 [Thioclava sp. F42-5]|uniref:c-type cytochrome n=1 Tax=Thioclava TaxID=285107 RepID=UPI00098B4355|nr:MULTISPECIES: cytochrome c [Thioclava]OWY05945.1 hypothetical protein B6V75_07540 [Thioclava sp. F1Mire-8]OWY11239.1 hypothetical protein B6V74_04270 [Thioclava sp. F42-5]OWY13690.1 hypothetical protein B6V72_06695 [Thioclava sp. F34-6]
MRRLDTHSGTALTGLVTALVLCASAAYPGSSDQQALFTSKQASSGHDVYKKHCADCHGSDLMGDAGPALAGKKFADSLDYSGMTGKQLYDFIAKHMPKDDPGELTDKQYLQTFAYLLCKNGFKPGDSAIDQKAIDAMDLQPLPDSSQSSCD